MKEKFSILEAANAIVEKADDRSIATLQEWSNAANHKAQGCGCSMCKGEARRADNALYDYLITVYNGPCDSGEHYDDPVENGFIENEGKNLLDTGFDSGSDDPVGRIT